MLDKIVHMTNLFNMRPSTNYDYKHNDMKWNIID